MEGTIKCKRCRWCFTEEEEYRKHLEDHILCKRCHLGFNKRDYRNHMKDHAYNESKCPHCHKQFKPSNPEHVGTMYDDHLHSCKRAPLLFTQKKTSDSTSSQISTSVQKMPEPNFCDEDTKKSKYEKGSEFLESNIKPCVVILTDVSGTSGKNCKAGDVTMVDNISNGSTVVKKMHTVSTTHRCNCGGEFSSKDDYELHVERKHTSLHCSKCGFTFKSVVAHALHSCNETSFTANVTTGNYDRLSSKNANVGKVSSDAFGQCEISKLPAASTSLSANHDSCFFNEDCDIKPIVPSGNFHSTLVKKLVEQNVSLSSIKAEPIVPSSHNKPSLSGSTTPQNAEFPLNVSSSSITKNVETTTCVVHKNNCNTLEGFCERNATLYTKKQRNSVDTNPKHHVQTSIAAHHLPWHGHFGKATHYPQVQHHQQNMYGPYPQWDSMDVAKVKNMAQCACYQCKVSKVNFNNSLMTDNLSKPGNEMLYFTNASLHQMHKSEYAYYPTHSRLPCLIPALNKEASVKYHGACMPQNLVSGKQIESSLKFHKFPEILNTSSIVNTKSNIYHFNDIRTVKDFADRPKKIVNVVFPEARSDCHASAVMSVDEKQSISHYNCEMCSNLFHTAESVIMHLQDEHHVKIGNELRVFAL